MKKGKISPKFWLVIGITNAFVIYIASFLFPSNIVLGNDRISTIGALLVNALILAALLSLVVPIGKAMKIKTDDMTVNNLLYGIVNITGLWVLGRVASYGGLGVSSIWTVLVLGIILTGAQFIAGKTFVTKGGK